MMRISTQKTRAQYHAASTGCAEARSVSDVGLRITAVSASSAVCGAPHTAEFERDRIRTLTSEGRESAKARG